MSSADPAWREFPALTCDTPDLRFPPAALDGPAGAELSIDPAGAALRQFLAEPDTEEMRFPDSGWRRVLQTPEAVVFLAPGSNPALVFVAFGQSPSGWTLDKAGECRLQPSFPEGFGIATWRLDPASPPHPTDSTIDVLATEVACSGGKSPIDRILPPMIADAPTAITIILAVRTLPGEHDCPANPEVGLAIDLPSAIGDRPLLDGSTVPAQPRS